MRITTLRTYGECSDFPQCPSVHDVDTDPERRYVISKAATVAERHVFGGLVAVDEVVGWMPSGFLPEGNAILDRTRDVCGPGLVPGRQYVITTAVTDPVVLAAFASMTDDDEQLGTVPVRALTVV